MNEKLKEINKAQLEALRSGNTALAVKLDQAIAREMSRQGFRVCEPIVIGGN